MKIDSKNGQYSAFAVSNKTNYIINLIFIMVTLVCVIPILLVIIISFTDEKDIIMNGYSYFPNKFSLLAYKYLFSDSARIVRAYGVTIFVTVAGTLLSTLMTALYAYPISRKDFEFKRFFSFYVFFTMLFNGGLVPFYIFYTKYLHMKDNIFVLIIPALLMPFNVLIMKTFFSTSLPDSVVESAKIDGAGDVRIFFSIVIPLSLPVFATIGLFTTLMYWNDWYNSLLFISNTKLVSLQFLMYNVMRNIDFLSLNAANNANIAKEAASVPSETIRMAMAIMGMGPILLAYPFFQKYFIKGLTIGAVKG